VRVSAMIGVVLIDHHLGESLGSDQRVRRANPLPDLRPAVVIRAWRHRHRDPAVATEAVASGFGRWVGGDDCGGFNERCAASGSLKMKFFPRTRNVG
jgi:hypothetical protein